MLRKNRFCVVALSFFMGSFMVAPSASAVTLNSSQVSGSGIKIPGSSLPTWLPVAVGVGKAVGKWVPIVQVGMTVLDLILKDRSNNSVNLVPSTGTAPVPSGWSSPDNPPSTVGLITGNKLGFGVDQVTLWPDGNAACKFASQQFPGIVAYRSSDQQCVDKNGAATGSAAVYTQCPNGYTQSGSVCNLSNSTVVKWPSDGVRTYYPDVNGNWSSHPRDPDNSTYSPWSGSGANVYTRLGTDDVGNPTTDTVTAKPGGGYNYDYTQQYVDDAGNSAVSKQGYQSDPSGLVTNEYSQTFNNSTLTNINTSAPAAPVDTSLLAKDATLQQTNQKLDKLDQDLNPTNPGVPDLGNSILNPMTQLNGDIDNLQLNNSSNPAPDLGMPDVWSWAAGTCYPASWDVGRFGTVSLDKFCQIYDDHVRSLLEWIVAMWGVFYLFHFWYETVREI